ncbi:MAG: cardiolipin synthase B [Arenimonas sp.]|uniref:phospholipase D-like domain-containing protein n=1 Tax=Arenimonas sp. TaxID=1872635 RepID=UPI0025C63052|nr:phospholipase D-like domain-containing protein [Arenimonas sp.]MBW8367060.1 cardiolipin synthase B [Arenimonas sp.]
MQISRKKAYWLLAATVLGTMVAVLFSFNFMRSEKTIERSIEHDYAINDPQLRREMGVLLGPGITAGNRVEALDNGEQIFPAMLEAIRGAQRTINFETYIYWSGEIGKELSDALAERARAGVEVNVIIDWVGGMKLDPDSAARMKGAGVRLEYYRPLAWYNFSRINKRTHRKLLVVDGRVGFTGGVGIADQWAGNAQDPDHWRDMHFRVEGPVVAQIQAAFIDNWIKTTGHVLNGEEYFPPLAPVGDMDAHLFMSSPEGGSESMHLMYLMAIAATRETLDVHASYFVPDELTVRALRMALKRGVRVRVLVPGEHIDSDLVKVSARAIWGDLLQGGAEIHIYQPTMMHVKSLIADGLLVSVGSTNFDVRSFQLNDEASLNIYDRDFAAHMTATFERDLLQAEPYTYQEWLDRPWHEKLAETVVLPLKSQL